ncbi:MAG: hypothetical protein ACM37W_22335 [Actinomycetota bacterium]
MKLFDRSFDYMDEAVIKMAIAHFEGLGTTSSQLIQSRRSRFK